MSAAAKYLCLTCVLSLALCTAERSRAATAAKGLSGRIIVGYQGWFGCPGDYAGNQRWQHWVIQGKDSETPTAENIRVDLLPNLNDIATEDRCRTGLHAPDGTQIWLFSSQNPRVVAAHFRLMAARRIDGVAVQRFIGIIDDRPDNPQGRLRSDHMIQNVLAAAEATDRVFFITYDVSGAPAETVIADIRRDWQHLAGELRVTSSQSYLHIGAKPVLELWGFGFTDHPGSPPDVAQLIGDLKSGSQGLQATVLIGGVPSQWRTLAGDSQSDPRWGDIYRSYDIISPWSVGRFTDDAGANAFLHDRVLPDLAVTRPLRLGYLPVVFPGFSWSNLQLRRGNRQLAIFNQIPRRCGNFLWRQIANLLTGGVEGLYGAMFDELDEGTAMLPAVTRPDKLPVGANFVALNQDGCSLPPDWYLRVLGAASEFVGAMQAPPSSLDAVLRP